jgi:hypothetical protein
MALAESIVGGKKELAASNTAEALTTTSRIITGLIIKASSANTHPVYVGSSEVNANWPYLEAKEWLSFNVADPSKFYVYGTMADSVTWMALVP